MPELLISVIVPVYKAQDYLHICIESILNQTYKNLEVILVDDGSPDECPSICDRYAKEDGRVTVIHQENQGQAAARNTALDCCKGDIVAFVDSDDWLEPNAYETMVEMMVRENLDVVFCAASIIEDGSKTGERFHYFEDGAIRSANEILKLCLADYIGGQPWLKIYRKNCFAQVRFPVGRIYEDLAVSHLPFEFATRVGFVDRPLYNYRLNLAGTSLAANPIKAGHIFWGFKDHFEYAKTEFSDPEILNVCLSKAAIHALGACHQAMRYPNIKSNQAIIDAETFLKSNFDQLMGCNQINIKYRIAIALFVKAKNIYVLVHTWVDRLKKK